VVTATLPIARGLLALALPALVETALDWVRGHPGVLGALVFGSVALFVGTLFVVPVLIARMRADHFMWRDPPPDAFLGRHPVVRWSGRVVKNLVGLVLLLMGIAMLVLPGQGILTILIALSLLDFPGKRALELRLVRQRHVRRTIDWIRERAQQPPLRVPDDEPHA
jgi:hypothetical protein